MIWNIAVYSKLPDFYKPAIWDGIPKVLNIFENIFRYIVFFIPALFHFSISTVTQKMGLIIYIVGLAIYFSSWLIQVISKSQKTQSLIFRAAPAYTTIIWLMGIWLMCSDSYIGLNIIKSIYLPVIIVFVCAHSYHAYLVYNKINISNRYNK